MTEPGKSSSSIRRRAKEGKVSPLAKALRYSRFAGWVLLCLLGMFYAGFLRAFGKGRVPFIERSTVNVLLLILPVILFCVHMALRERKRSEAYGKKLYAKGRYAKARKVFEKTPGERSGEVSKMLADMYIAGLGGAADPGRAVECYALALENCSTDDLHTDLEPEDAPKQWLEDILERIAPIAGGGNPDALELAAKLSHRLGRVEEALAYARRLPDDDGKPGWQTECLVELIREARTARSSAIDTEGGESADPDIRVPLTWRSNVAPLGKFLFAIAAAAFFVFFVSFLRSEIEGYLAPLFTLSIVCGGIAFHLRRKGNYGLGCSALAREKFDLALQYFTRGAEEHDPRAAKMLGDMRQYGRGFARDPALAFAGYKKCLFSVEICRFFRRAHKELGFAGRLFIRRLRSPMPEKEEPALWNELRRSLSDLLVSGFDADKVHGVLVKVLQEQNDWQAIREFGAKLPPTPENLNLIASGVIHDPGAEEADVADAMATLEQLAEEGDAFAAARLATHYGGVGPRKGQLENTGKSLVYLSSAFELAETKPESERVGAVENVRKITALLLERHGAGFLDDKLCLMAL